MRVYSKQETEQNIENLHDQHDKFENEINELQEKRKAIKLWNRKTRDEIDQEIWILRFNIGVCNASLWMFDYYQDTHFSSRCRLDDDTFLKIEKDAEAGSSIDKLMIFCYKCFVDHTLLNRDLKRLEMEAEEGDQTSLEILIAYTLFFADE